jgi:hypothetical protein
MRLLVILILDVGEAPEFVVPFSLQAVGHHVMDPKN